jgi:poly-beta-1,6 N-acetyl-D-glucosamine synthase
MINTIFRGLFILFLLVLLIYVLQEFNKLTFDSNLYLQIGADSILIFSFIVLFRYSFLLLFSMLNLRKSLKEEQKREEFKVKPLVSIIVPCFNEEVMIKASLEGLIKQDYPNFEIIVIDDGSSDNTYPIIKSMQFEGIGKSLKAYTKQNGGKANALNYGIEMAHGEFVLCVDADSRLSPDVISNMVEHFVDEEVGAVAGNVYVSNTDNLLTKLQALEYIQGLNLIRNGQAFFKLVSIIPGPIGMFRKSILKKVGMYSDESFAEDCEVTLRILEAGYKVDSEPDAISYTEAPESFTEFLKQRYRWTRGILQALLLHKYSLFLPKRASFGIVLWYMMFEAIVWPIASILANIFIVFMGIFSGYSELFIYWWIIFSILDLSASIYCISITKERLSLVFYSFYYRMIFVNITNIAKFLATLEEFIGIKMKWGTLQRQGKI